MICNNFSAGAYTRPGIIKLATPIVARTALAYGIGIDWCENVSETVYRMHTKCNIKGGDITGKIVVI